MTTTDAIAHARDAFAKKAWSDAAARFSAVDETSPLQAEDLERLALAAYLVGWQDDSVGAWTRAHQGWLDAGEAPRAARCAFFLACGLMFHNDFAPAMGWVARGQRVLDDARADCGERGFVLVLNALPVMFGGDPATAEPSFIEAAEIADRFSDRDVGTLARLARGQAHVMQDDAPTGLRFLDESMAAVVAGEVSPVIGGIAYCTMIASCQHIYDLRRAREWTAALTRWCDAQPDLVPYRGHCLVHRCEIMTLSGAWAEAQDAAERACEWLSQPTPTSDIGSAHYQLGEVHRLRGSFDEAEKAYREASRWGREPQPGLALLRLAQGRIDAAGDAIRRFLDETRGTFERAKVLPAYVEIMITAGDLEAARRAVAELAGIAADVGAQFLDAVAASVTGSLLLAEGDAKAALPRLREAVAAWRELEAPYESARTRVDIATACRALGDVETADMELASARRNFEDIGAQPDVARLGGSAASGGLSPRELEVIRLVATGKTNRAIAKELVLSEKTVARHVSNIFTKLGVASRAAATAYAYEHGLVSPT